MVKEDFPDVAVAQSKYRYSHRLVIRRKGLSLGDIKPSLIPVVDALINYDGLVTPWELLQSTIDADEDYACLAAEG